MSRPSVPSALRARVIASGDPGQLPPVMDRQFFDAPHIVLSEVHRQAWDSPIIRQAHAIRSDGFYTDDGANFRVLDRAPPDLLMEIDVALCWKNKTRLLLNRRIRSVRGFGDGPLRKGEPVMCLKNHYGLKLWNGAVYTLTTDREPGDGFGLRDEITDREVWVAGPVVEGVDENYETLKYDDNYIAFALGYAATVHKAQGSEWPNVLVIDECRREERRQLLYTAVTRAVERCTVVKW